MNANQLKSLHYYTLSSIPTPLSRYYANTLESFNHEKSIKYPDSITLGRMCQKCSQVNIPGINIKVRLRKNGLVYKCMSCKHVNRYKLPPTPSTDSTASTPSSTTPSSTTTSSTMPKKKRLKKKSLQALLDQKKQLTSSGSLNLMEFMN